MRNKFDIKSEFENKYYFSLPRPVGREKRHKIREFSYKVDVDSLRGNNKGKQTKKRRMRRAKSLEQILDGSSRQGSSSNASSTSSTSGGASNSENSNNANPNVWVVDGVRHHQHPLASYCTIDRARLRRPRQDSISNGDETANLTLPRKK